MRPVPTGEPASTASHTSAHAVSVSFRLRYLIRLSVVLTLGALLSGLAVYLILARDLDTYARSIAVIRGTREVVVGAAVLSGLIQVVVTGLLVVVIALLASHKIVGPTVRLERLLKGAAAGRLSERARFRWGDQLGRLEDGFNRLLARFVRQARAVGGRLEEIETLRAGMGPVTDEAHERAANLTLARQMRSRASALADYLRKADHDREQDLSS